MHDTFPPTLEAALSRVNAIRPDDYSRSRNFLLGAVTRLSPYITHGLVSLPEVLSAVTSRYPLDTQHKFVFELGWREYFRHVWAFRGREIFDSLHEGPLPEADYATVLPVDVRQACTGVPVIDMAVRTLYATGYLHNHARMWLASYVVHVRKVHWRVAADWLYGHLLDGDLASNHLSWQWVAGTGSNKPYLFNAENVSKYAPVPWHSPDSVIDDSYEALASIATQRHPGQRAAMTTSVTLSASVEPALIGAPPEDLGWTPPNAKAVEGREVWLVHPWNLGKLPASLPEGAVIIGVFLSDFHQAWPWSARRWQFVSSRMRELVTERWHGDAVLVREALSAARRIRTTNEPHLMPWLECLAQCEPAPALFASVKHRCDSFSAWWKQVSRATVR